MKYAEGFVYSRHTGFIRALNGRFIERKSIMPIYEYACQKCGDLLEIIQKFNDKPPAECSKCNGELKKVISNTSFVLKGTGWYKTDYASKPKKDRQMPEKSGNKKESKTETKKEAGVKT